LTNVLVTGVSGTGKPVALVELSKRGFRVVKGCARNHVKFHDRFDAVY
jgi:predicted ATPase